jgi:ABC-2 type transport system ATP-binding protein
VRGLAAQGRTVLVSSHLMSEVELTVDHLVVIGRGRLLADAPVGDVVRRGAGSLVRVASPAADLPRLLERAGATVTAEAGGTWRVEGTSATAIGELAAAHGLVLHRLEPTRSTLEEVYTAMTHDSVEHRALGADR